MKKIVINKCYGGFRLSYDAIMRYSQLKGQEITAYVNSVSDTADTFQRYNKDTDQHYFIHYANINKDTLTGEELNEYYFSDRDIERDDPALVRLVQEMGEKANGQCANLRIVEIPDKVTWEIDEYDGIESVEEKHRSWS